MFFDLSCYLREFVGMIKNKGDTIVRIHLRVYLKLSWQCYPFVLCIRYILNAVTLGLSRFCSK